MTRALLDQMIADAGQGFDMLFATLKDLRDDDWTWLPDGAARSIRAIVGHVVSCKLMYDDYAFGDASMTWDDPRLAEAQSPASTPASIPLPSSTGCVRRSCTCCRASMPLPAMMSYRRPGR